MKELASNHSDAFRRNFPNLSLPYLGKDCVRFMLAIIEQNILTTFGSSSQLELSCVFPADMFHIEHIAPRGYAKEQAWGHLGPDFYTDSFPNLTMLESTRNTSVGNGSFESKLKEYSVSKSYVTSMISDGGVGGGKNNGAVQASKKFSQHSTWNATRVAIRSQELADILCEELGVTKGLIDNPQQPKLKDTFLVIPQGRPENAIKILLKAKTGMYSYVELNESINSPSGLSDKENFTDRNFQYNLEALEYLGLGYRGDDSQFTLSDTGNEIFSPDGNIDYDLLDLCFTAALIRSGLSIKTINKIKYGKKIDNKKEVLAAFSIIFEGLSDKTLGHRVTAIFSWAKYIQDRI